MSSSSSNARSLPGQEIFRLIPCPLCVAEVETAICRRGTRPGVRYYKCVHYSGGSCRFFEWQETYAPMVHGELQPNPADRAQQEQQQVQIEAGAAAVAAGVVVAPPPDFNRSPPGVLVGANAPALSSPAPSWAADVARINLLVSVINLLATVVLIGLVLIIFAAAKH